MTKHLQTLVFVIVFALAFGSPGRTQEPSAAPPAKTASSVQPEQPRALTPLKLQIVIARYQGEKKISSLPYTLSVNANDGRMVNGQWVPYGMNLRMGAKVPVPVVAPPGDRKQAEGPTSYAAAFGYNYQDVGTNIDCSVTTIDGGRFRVELRIEDSSVYADGQAAQGAPRLNDIPTFRTFRVNNPLILRDGQSSQFTVATDKISGEVVKIDVTLTVVK